MVLRVVIVLSLWLYEVAASPNASTYSLFIILQILLRLEGCQFPQDTGPLEVVVIRSCPTSPVEVVTIHCVAGLGRVPVLATVALVGRGFDPFDVVGWIRALHDEE